MANDMNPTAPRDLAAEAYSRRDLWLCLARAFAPPGGDDYLVRLEQLPCY